MEHWVTFGMSPYHTPGFSDTSRLMTRAFTGLKLYIEPPKSFSHWRTLDGTILKWRLEHQPADALDIVLPPLPIPSRVDLLRITRKIQAARLESLLRQRFGADWREHTALYVTNWTPQFQPVIELLEPKHLIFDLVDDVLSFPYGFNRDRVLNAWRKLAAQASVTVAVSPALQAMADADLKIPALVLPNGVDVELFMKPRSLDPSLPNAASYSARAGFAGTMNHWIDFDAICHLAQSHPTVGFYLMGRVGQFGSRETETSYQRALSLPNVHYIGTVSYDDLPGVLHQMDILLLPRKDNEASRASNPLKLFEYLAVGKPIVTCGVQVPHPISKYVYSAETSGGLTAAFQFALAEQGSNGTVMTDGRHAIAENHTWKQRVEHALHACSR